MPYIDAFLAPVPTKDRDRFVAWLKDQHAVFKEYGADVIADAWEDDVPQGEVTSMHMAVALKEDESVSLGWILWPDKETRDAAWAKVMDDPRMAPDQSPMPFDGKRMIFGGFAPVLVTN